MGEVSSLHIFLASAEKRCGRGRAGVPLGDPTIRGHINAHIRSPIHADLRSHIRIRIRNHIKQATIEPRGKKTEYPDLEITVLGSKHT